MKSFRFSRSGLVYTSAVMLLVPALRLFPSLSARLAGRGAWLSAIAAMPVLIIYSLFLSAFMSQRSNREGMAELIMRSCGSKIGKVMLFISAAWFLLYSAFVLRAGAERLITTVYPNSSPAFFIIITGTAASYAALGSSRSIVRCARMIFSLVSAVLLLILCFSLFNIDIAKLFPLTLYDIKPVAKGAFPAVDVAVCVMYAVCFLENECDNIPGRFKDFSLWAVCASLFMAALSAAIIGNFGAELVTRLIRPFFSLVRNLVFFNTLERTEALIVALWVFPELIMASVFLYAAQYCLRLALSFDTQYKGERFSDLANGRYIAWLGSAVSIAFSVLMAENAAALSEWSEKIIPAVNMLYAFVLLPGVFVVGKIRAKGGQ